MPQRKRGEQRVIELLAAAASVLTEVGYDAATMTEIAERAGASIGAAYQYFPNKAAIALALRTEYDRELEAHTNELQESTCGMTIEAVAHRFVDVMVDFLDAHPAYFVVLEAPVSYKRSRLSRDTLRKAITRIYTLRNPSLSRDAVRRITNVTVEIIKSMNVLYAEADPKERHHVVAEYRLAVAAYLLLRLSR